MQRLTGPGLTLLALLCAMPLQAQDHAHGPPVPTSMMAGQPASTPMRGVHFAASAWSLMAGGTAAFVWMDASGLRGDRMGFSTNHIMLSAARPLAKGTFELRGMATVEPLMGSRGYPLLLQTGETADGQNPMVDRQHPHDAAMELSASWRRSYPQDIVLTGYLALVGEPAIGPPAFMHRLSGRDIPVAPIGHHFLDATHVTYGVATVGLVSQQKLSIEVSAFNGLEPDQNRWGIERPRFDSWALRATVAAGPDVALQASMARLNSPERMHPGVDQVKLTASAIWNRPLSNGNLQTTLAVGRNLNLRTLIPVIEARKTFPAPVLNHYISLADSSGVAADSLTLLFPARVQWAMLLESTLAMGRSTGFFRFETVHKDELFPATDLRHSQIYTAGKFDIGYIFDVRRRPARFGVGAAASLYAVASALREAYGRYPTAVLLFTRVDF
jgi:hypothetical protein